MTQSRKLHRALMTTLTAPSPLPAPAIRVDDPKQYLLQAFQPHVEAATRLIEDSKKIARFVAHARADVPDLGKAILRLTGPAMRDRIALAIVAGCMRGAAPNALADSIMDLLQEESA